MTNWIFLKISGEDLIFRLCCREITPEFVRNTIAHVKTPGALWRVVETTVRVDGFFGMKAGVSRREIICDVIRRDEDTGELGYLSIPESEPLPYLYSCPIHFFELAPEVLNENWRRAVRQSHEDSERLMAALNAGTTKAAQAA